jgi:hypothetical protein
MVERQHQFFRRLVVPLRGMFRRLGAGDPKRRCRQDKKGDTPYADELSCHEIASILRLSCGLNRQLI